MQSQAENDWLMALSKLRPNKNPILAEICLLSAVIILVITVVKVIVVIFVMTAATHCGASNEYWLNGFDTDDSGSFTWIDSQNPTTYTNWYAVNSEPNSPEEQCIVASTGYLGVWNDIRCTEQRPVVCERNT